MTRKEEDELIDRAETLAAQRLILRAGMDKILALCNNSDGLSRFDVKRIILDTIKETQ